MNQADELAPAREHSTAGRHTEALLSLRRVSPQASLLPEYFMLKGLSHLHTMSLQFARTAFEKYLELKPEDAAGRELFSEINFRLTRHINRAPWEQVALEKIRRLSDLVDFGAGTVAIENLLIIKGILVLSDGTILEESVRGRPFDEIVGTLFYFDGKLTNLFGQHLLSAELLASLGPEECLRIECAVISPDFARAFPVIDAAPVIAERKRSSGMESQWAPVIEKQLSQYEPGCLTKERFEVSFREAIESIKVVIRNGRISEVIRSAPIVRTPRVHGYIGLLQDTLRHFDVPDVALIISTVDLPISSLNPLSTATPIFGFCTTDLHRSLLLPFARFGRDDVGLGFDAGLSSESSWEHLLPKLEKLRDGSPWEGRSDAVFFAGHHLSAGDVRLKYAGIALKNPANFLCRLTATMDPQGGLAASEFKTLTGAPIPMRDNANFRYLMHLDGVTAADRLRISLALGACVIKNESPYWEFYYPLLEPNVHFIPVSRELTELPGTLEALRSNPEYPKSVAAAGSDFIKNKLTYESVLGYTAQMLRGYRELWASPP